MAGSTVHSENGIEWNSSNHCANHWACKGEYINLHQPPAIWASFLASSGTWGLIWASQRLPMIHWLRRRRLFWLS